MAASEEPRPLYVRVATVTHSEWQCVSSGRALRATHPGAASGARAPGWQPGSRYLAGSLEAVSLQYLCSIVRDTRTYSIRSTRARRGAHCEAAPRVPTEARRRLSRLSCTSYKGI